MITNNFKVKPVLSGNKTNLQKTNFYTDDLLLQKLLKERLNLEFYDYAHTALTQLGKSCANEIDERARHTDREGEPKLIKFDAYGNDISKVWVNEGYKQTVKEVYETGIVGYIHKEIPEIKQKGNYVYSFAQNYLLAQTEPGFQCPVTLTMATAYLLDHYAEGEVREKFLPHVLATGNRELYEGATFLTERQGGSDVGANIVKAVKEDGEYRLYGEKYFASNVGQAKVVMVLARLEGAKEGSRGLTLFAVPWHQEDKSLNNVKIRRLKDKLGVRAVPSGEVEFHGAKAYIVGDATRGFYYMMEALNLSRINNAVASLGIMKRALDEAKAYTKKRDAFGKRLIEYPMIQDTLVKLTAKLTVELGATFDLIDLYDIVAKGEATEEENIMHRLYIALMKKETAEQAIKFSHEAIELHGGNGYIEDFVTPRLLRDAQVLTVWEGTENILGLEVVRLISRYNADIIYIKEMNKKLEKIKASKLKTHVEKKLEEIKQTFETFKQLDYAEQTFESKRLAEEMTYIYEAIVSLDLANKHGSKYEKIAEIYIESTWNLRQIGDKMKTVEHFNDIIDYG